MPTRLALPHQRATALWSTQGMRHVACGTPTAHNSLQLPKDAQWKWSGRRRRSWSPYWKFTLQLKFWFDAAILLAHLAHALRGRAQRVVKGWAGGGEGSIALWRHCAHDVNDLLAKLNFCGAPARVRKFFSVFPFFLAHKSPATPPSIAHPPGLPLSLGSLVPNGFAALLFCHRNLRVSRI